MRLHPPLPSSRMDPSIPEKPASVMRLPLLDKLLLPAPAGPLRRRHLPPRLLLCAIILLAFSSYVALHRRSPGPVSEHAVRPSGSAPAAPDPPLRGATPLRGPLHVSGPDILDATNAPVKLVSINWYGASDVYSVPSGLDVAHRSAIARTILSLGFNSVRLPYSDFLVARDPAVPPHLLRSNPDLVGQSALAVYGAVVSALTAAGVAVILNNHITDPKWCCGPDLCNGLWYNAPPRPVVAPRCVLRQTEDDWIEHWETVLAPHVNDSLVVGADLRNEVRALWGTLSWETWAAAAERAGRRLRTMKPDVLVVVEGIGSANFLQGVRDRPVVLTDGEGEGLGGRGGVLYSAHVYAWSGWGSWEGMYSRRPYAAFRAAMMENWAFLIEEGTAPVWVGEFGTTDADGRGEGDARYWEHLVKFLGEVGAGFGYWAVNPRKPGSEERESYGLLGDDWVTPVWDYRLRDLRGLMDG